MAAYGSLDCGVKKGRGGETQGWSGAAGRRAEKRHQEVREGKREVRRWVQGERRNKGEWRKTETRRDYL